jgi:hypothetical protein
LWQDMQVRFGCSSTFQLQRTRSLTGDGGLT